MDTIKDIKETYFFLGEHGKRTYCGLYEPMNTSTDHAIILCKSIWGVRIRTHRIFTNIARMLCQKGYFVFTCDYSGDGNSEGDVQDLTFESMVENIIDGCKYLSNNHNVSHFSLLGFEIGALVAMHVQVKLKTIDKMLLIEPIDDLKPFLSEVLRANLSHQLSVHKQILKDRDVLISEIKRGISVNVDGFIINKRLYESFESVSINNDTFIFNGKVHFVFLNNSKKIKQEYLKFKDVYENATLDVIDREFVWSSWKYFIPKPKELFHNISTFFN
jgi:alpha/beta superfamily hydrolase